MRSEIPQFVCVSGSIALGIASVFVEYQIGFVLSGAAMLGMSALLYWDWNRDNERRIKNQEERERIRLIREKEDMEYLNKIRDERAMNRAKEGYSA